MKSDILLPLFVSLLGSAATANADTVTLRLNDVNPKQIILPEIYGQFAEHLGACIYGGLWVGPESSIPNTQGYRNDVLQ